MKSREAIKLSLFEKNKNTQRLEFKIGKAVLRPLRYIKTILKLNDPHNITNLFVFLAFWALAY